MVTKLENGRARARNSNLNFNLRLCWKITGRVVRMQGGIGGTLWFISKI